MKQALTVNVALLLCLILLSSISNAHPLDENIILDIEQGSLSLDNNNIQRERQEAERRKRIRIIQAMSGLTRFTYFIKQGMTHIVPLGVDHVLFVIGLALLSTNIVALLTLVSAFTLAHSITLMALILQWIPTLLGVEVFIAISIIYVGIDSIFRPNKDSKVHLLITIVFGLIHGIGYAGALSNIGFSPQTLWSSLLAFNLGIEVAQISVILLFLLLTYKLKPKAQAYAQFKIILAAAISTAGLFYLYSAIAMLFPLT